MGSNLTLGERSDDFPEVGENCIQAWRHWFTGSGDLQSINDGIQWPYLKEFEAECGLGADHIAPDRDCECGIYVAKSLADLSNAGYTLERIDANHAIGRVKIWGKIIPHDRGYRAQYAYPDLVLCSNPLTADLIARNYRCEVIIPEIQPLPMPQPATPQVVNNYLESMPEVHCKGVTLGVQIMGQYFAYNGPFDHTAIGRWFASILAKTANENQFMMNQMCTLSVSFLY